MTKIKHNFRVEVETPLGLYAKEEELMHDTKELADAILVRCSDLTRSAVVKWDIACSECQIAWDDCPCEEIEEKP